MSWSKRQIISQAFDGIGLAGFDYDIAPEQFHSALRQLDAMVAMWNAKGIRIGYPLPSSPETSDLDSDSNIPDSAIEAVYTNLQLRLAPTYGKAVPIELKSTALQGFNALLRSSSITMEMQLPNTMPLGAGNKGFRYNREFATTTKSLDVGGDSELIYE